MSNAEMIFAALAACAPIISVIVAIVVAKRNKDKDIQREAKELGQMQSDLGYIKSGIDDLKKAQIRHDEKLDALSDRVTAVETSLSQHLKDKNAHNYAKYPKAKPKQQGGHK